MPARAEGRAVASDEGRSDVVLILVFIMSVLVRKPIPVALICGKKLVKASFFCSLASRTASSAVRMLML